MLNIVVFKVFDLQPGVGIDQNCCSLLDSITYDRKEVYSEAGLVIGQVLKVVHEESRTDFCEAVKSLRKTLNRKLMQMTQDDTAQVKNLPRLVAVLTRVVAEYRPFLERPLLILLNHFGKIKSKDRAAIVCDVWLGHKLVLIR